MKKNILFGLAIGFLAACNNQQSTPQLNTAEQSNSQTTNETTLDNPISSTDQFDRDEVVADLHTHIAELASDAYEGRAPATPGEEKTIDYLKKTFTSLGLQPGNKGSFLQKVPVTEITTDSNLSLNLAGKNYQIALKYGTEMMVSTQQQIEKLQITDSELMFVGYGIVAPERNWNDYANIDVIGKTVIILVNDPGYATQDPEIFNGNAMTYYGRWTYKYEEAARQGAAAAFIVHETGAAGYPWEVVSGSWSGPQITLQDKNLNADKNKIEGWLTLESATALFSGAGLNFPELKKTAASANFKAIAMADIKASITLNNNIRNSESNNVIARILGTTRSEETIVYTAHWDHLGRKDELEGDQIYNGAADNASGVAGLLALAKQYAELPKAPERSIVFLAVTAEESGLLGSKWYGEHPVYPLAKTVANINMDNLNLYGSMKDVVVVGHGSSELEDYLAEAAKLQGRYLSPEPTPEKGYFYRSDHFNFAKHGVPALYAEGGNDSFAHGMEWGKAQAQDYIDNRYHKPSDEYNPDWDLNGAIDDLGLYFAVGYKISQETTFPNWYDGNEFRTIRDQSLKSMATRLSAQQ